MAFSKNLSMLILTSRKYKHQLSRVEKIFAIWYLTKHSIYRICKKLRNYCLLRKHIIDTAFFLTWHYLFILLSQSKTLEFSLFISIILYIQLFSKVCQFYLVNVLHYAFFLYRLSFQFLLARKFSQNLFGSLHVREFINQSIIKN